MTSCVHKMCGRTQLTIIYVPLSSARQNKESEKGLFITNKQKTNTKTYVNQRDDMLTKTRN